MPSPTTTLADILSGQLVWQTMNQVPESERVGFIDLALQDETISYKFPFRRKKTTLRVFEDVTLYPSPSDYSEMAFLDNDEKKFNDRARFRFTSFDEFLENLDYRNDLADIYDDGTLSIGCRYRTKKSGTRIVDSAEDVTKYAVSGTATAVAKDTVFFKDGAASMKITVTAGTATITINFTSFADSNYKQRYAFYLVYLDAAPTSIGLRFGNDASNFLLKNVTTQFSGQAFVADDWNILAMDLNNPDSTTGTINSNAFDYAAIILNGAVAGTYYVDATYLRRWELLDLWYNSTNYVRTGAGVYQERFKDANNAYSGDTSLIGPKEWANYISYQAMLRVAADKNDKDWMASLQPFVTKAEADLKARFPAKKYLITKQAWRFNNSPGYQYVRYPNFDLS